MPGVLDWLRAQSQSLSAVESVIPNSATTLCTTCTILDLKKILRDGVLETNMVSLGTLFDITDKSDRCAFCRLVADLIRRRWRLDDFPDTNIYATNVSLSAHAINYIPDLDEKKLAHRLFFHASRPSDITTALLSAKAAPYLDLQLLEEDSGKVARSKALHGRRISEKVDIHLVKRWMKLCERAHGDACEKVGWKSGVEDLPECVRMVDVIRMSLVRAGHNCRYVALSYVWGKPGGDYLTSTANARARNSPSGLKESALPATIVDAIQLTRLIGERYLWVDALCIVQDSEEDKAAQVSVMDRVYGRALLTIIAADGASAWAGLAGLRAGTRRPNQHVEYVQGLHLSIPLPSLSEAATDSTWNTRGWTFQEAVLSRRRLYFTKHQMYFECERDVLCEDVVAESKTLQGSSNPMRLMGLNPLSLVSDMAMNLRAYETAVALYTQRRLTVDSDIISAAAGFLNAMVRAVEPFGSSPPEEVFRFGMWIRNLEVSLLWQPGFDAIHTRRILPGVTYPCWPSWAWSGWKGAVQYGIEQQMLDGMDADLHGDPVESLVTPWYLVDEDGAIIQLDVKRIPPSWSVDGGADMHRSPYKYVTSQSYPSDPVLDFSPPNGTLIFRTQCAHFRVVKSDDESFLAHPRKIHTVFHISPVDQVSAGHCAGRIILPASTPSLSIFEFIVLSRCDGLTGLWDEGRWGKRYYGCMLHVMAVQRIRDNTRVSERVGLGVIVESAWMETKAEERVVLLA